MTKKALLGHLERHFQLQTDPNRDLCVDDIDDTALDTLFYEAQYHGKHLDFLHNWMCSNKATEAVERCEYLRDFFGLSGEFGTTDTPSHGDFVSWMSNNTMFTNLLNGGSVPREIDIWTPAQRLLDD